MKPLVSAATQPPLTAETVRSEDFRGLHHLASRLGDRFRAGSVLYAGEQAQERAQREHVRAEKVAARKAAADLKDAKRLYIEDRKAEAEEMSRALHWKARNSCSRRRCCRARSRWISAHSPAFATFTPGGGPDITHTYCDEVIGICEASVHRRSGWTAF